MNLVYIDTCAMRDIIALNDEIQVDLFPILSKFRLGVTEELMQEYHQFHLEFKGKITFDFTLSLTSSERMEYINRFLLEEFDPADIEIFIAAKRDCSVVITNDRPLFLQCYSQHLTAFYLYDFLLAMVKKGHLKKNSMYKCYRYWSDINRFPKATLREIKNELTKIS